MPSCDASRGAAVRIFDEKQCFFRVTSLFGSKNRNKQPQPPGGRGTFNRKVQQGRLWFSFASMVFPGLIIGRKFSKLRQSTAFYYEYRTIL